VSPLEGFSSNSQISGRGREWLITKGLCETRLNYRRTKPEVSICMASPKGECMTLGDSPLDTFVFFIRGFQRCQSMMFLAKARKVFSLYSTVKH